MQPTLPPTHTLNLPLYWLVHPSLGAYTCYPGVLLEAPSPALPLSGQTPNPTSRHGTGLSTQLHLCQLPSRPLNLQSCSPPICSSLHSQDSLTNQNFRKTYRIHKFHLLSDQIRPSPCKYMQRNLLEEWSQNVTRNYFWPIHLFIRQRVTGSCALPGSPERGHDSWPSGSFPSRGKQREQVNEQRWGEGRLQIMASPAG